MRRDAMGAGRVRKPGRDGVEGCLNLKQMTSAVSRCAKNYSTRLKGIHTAVDSGSIGASVRRISLCFVTRTTWSAIRTSSCLHIVEFMHRHPVEFMHLLHRPKEQVRHEDKGHLPAACDKLFRAMGGSPLGAIVAVQDTCMSFKVSVRNNVFRT